MNAREELTAIDQKFNQIRDIMQALDLNRADPKSYADFGGFKVAEDILFKQEYRIREFGEKAFPFSEKQYALIVEQYNAQMRFIKAYAAARKAEKAAAETPAIVETVAQETISAEAPAASRSQIDWDRLDTMTGTEIHGFDKDEWDASVAEFEAEYPGDSYLEELKTLPFPDLGETKRLSITIPLNLYYEIELYGQKHEMDTWSQALVEIAANALGVKVRLPERGGARPGAGKKKKSDQAE